MRMASRRVAKVAVMTLATALAGETAGLAQVTYQQPYIIPDIYAPNNVGFVYPTGLTPNNVLAAVTTPSGSSYQDALVRFPASTSQNNVPSYGVFSFPTPPGYGVITSTGKISQYGLLAGSGTPVNNATGQQGTPINYIFNINNASYTHLQLSNSDSFTLTGVASSGLMTGSLGVAGFVRQTSGNYSTFTVPGSATTSPTAINASGWVTGSYTISGSSAPYGNNWSHAFLMTGGSAFNIDPPGVTYSGIVATDLTDNNLVTITVTYYGSAPQPPFVSTGYILNENYPATLNQIRLTPPVNNGVLSNKVNAINTGGYIAGVVTYTYGGEAPMGYIAAPQGSPAVNKLSPRLGPPSMPGGPDATFFGGMKLDKNHPRYLGEVKSVEQPGASMLASPPRTLRVKPASK